MTLASTATPSFFLSYALFWRQSTRYHDAYCSVNSATLREQIYPVRSCPSRRLYQPVRHWGLSVWTRIQFSKWRNSTTHSVDSATNSNPSFSNIFCFFLFFSFPFSLECLLFDLYHSFITISPAKNKLLNFSLSRPHQILFYLALVQWRATRLSIVEIFAIDYQRRERLRRSSREAE